MSIKLLLWMILILPWITVLFLDKNTMKRYIPVTIFTCFLMTIIFQIAYTYQWWTIYQSIVPWGYMIDVSFAYGLFAVGTLLIFYFTSHKFLIYLITNLIIDAFFAFMVLKVILPQLGIAHYKVIQPWQYFMIIFAMSFLIYGYNRWQQKVFLSPESFQGKLPNPSKTMFDSVFHIRAKTK